MNPRRPRRWVCLLLAIAALAGAAAVSAQRLPELRRADWQQRLGGQLPLRLTFADEQGQVGPLGRYFGRRPVAIILMYLSCSQLCPLTMQLTQRAFEQAGLTPGRDFELLAVSIDPWDRPAGAARRKAQLAHGASWQRGLHVLTAAPLGTDPATALAAAAGFGYVYDPHSRQYGHPAGWVLADADGRISHYFFGVRYDPHTLRTAVHAAASGGTPTWSQPLRLLCYCLVVLTGRYDGVIFDGLRAACLALLAVGALFLWRNLRRPQSQS